MSKIKQINTQTASERIAAALLKRSKAIADAVKSLQDTEARASRNQLAIRTLQIVKSDRNNK